MAGSQGSVSRSVSSWQQPLPKTTSRERLSLIADVADQVVACGSGRLRVGIDGRTGAGKTTFGHELAQQVSAQGRPVLRASLDDFKRPWRDRHLYDRDSGEGYYRHAFDYDTLTTLLLDPAGRLGPGRCVLCSIDPLTQIDHRDVVTHAPADSVLIVDGVFAFRPKINKHWDLRIWLEIDEHTSFERGIRRDGAWAGEAAEALHRDRYAVSEQLYLAEVDPLEFVDVVIDNTAFDRPRLLRRTPAG